MYVKVSYFFTMKSYSDAVYVSIDLDRLKYDKIKHTLLENLNQFDFGDYKKFWNSLGSLGNNLEHIKKKIL